MCRSSDARAYDGLVMSDRNPLRYVGTYDHVEVALSVNARGRVLVGTMNPEVAEKLALPRVDKYWWEQEVPPDDPRLVMQAIGNLSAQDAPGTDRLDPADRYFARLDGDNVPMALMRRHVTDAGYVDQILRDVDDWMPDIHGSVSRAILYALDSDLTEITVDQAGHVVHMVAQRSYQRLPSPRA